MANDDIFGQEANLADTEIADEINDSIVALVESSVPPADRSEAEIQAFTLNRDDWTASVRVHVIVQNSPQAFAHFSVPSTFTFDLDLRTGDASNQVLTILTPEGFPDIPVPIGTLKQILEGDFAKALELIPNGGVVEREIQSDYDRIRGAYYERYGRDNVYFASQRFVRWAGLGTAGKWVAQALVTGGADSGAIIKEAKKETLKELGLVGDWLAAHGQEQAMAMAKKILSGEQVAWPFVKLVWQTVRYSSRLRLGGRQVGGEFAVNRHAAFVIVWTSGDVAAVVDEGPLDNDVAKTPPREDNAQSSLMPAILMMLS